MRRAAWPLVWIALLSTATALLYFHRLGSIPPHLSNEEVDQARAAVMFAATGRNFNGELFPLYFPDLANPLGREPIWVYLGAALLKFFPFSEGVIRAPSAGAGVLNVVLMFALCRQIFGRTTPAVVAAGLLAIMPAHFMQSRIASMQVGMVTCVLGWLLFVARYSKTGRLWNVAAATFCLGLGMYTYVSGLASMPVYFLVTLLLTRIPGRGWTPFRYACTGFLVAFLPLATWYVFHPERLAQLAAFYTHGEYNKNLGPQGFIGAGAILHLDAWWDCFNPDKLFFSGDADLRFSTRTAGYLLLPVALPMIAGLWDARRQLTFEMRVLLLSGFVLSALPAALVSSSDVKRWLPFIPFAVLAATCGVERLLAGGRRLVQTCAVALLFAARWLTALPSPVLVMLCGVQGAVARWRRSGQVCALALLLLTALQMMDFLGYYFGQYRIDSSPYFAGNLQDAIANAMSTATDGDCVKLDKRIYLLDDRWDMYARAFGRESLARRTSVLNPDEDVPPSISCATTTILGLAGDGRFADWRSTAIPELNGTVRLAVYRRASR